MESPYHLTPDQIAGLTESQIVGMYGRPRDPKTGAPKQVGVKPRRDYRTPEESKMFFVELYTKLAGKTVEEAEAAWDKKTKG